MKTLKLNKLATTVGAVLALGLASQAYASPVFTIDPAGLGSALAPFQADFLGGLSSELLKGDVAAQTLTATSGWLNITGSSLFGNQIASTTSGINSDYGLYATFDLVATLLSGTFGAANSSYLLTSLNYSLWGDSAFDTTFTQANATTNTEATVSVGTADTLLGGGSLISGVAGFNIFFGASFNSLTSYANTAAGSLFFTQPSSFYTQAFQAFNNTSQGVLRAGDCTTAGSTNCRISITNAIGGVDFAGVPEPGTLGLMGLGLLGIASLRRRKTA